MDCIINAMKTGSLTVIFKECLGSSFVGTQLNVFRGRGKEERKGEKGEKEMEE